MKPARIARYVGFAWLTLALGVPPSRGAEPPVALLEASVATSAWQAAELPVYSDPDDNWAKDPSIIKAGETYYMYYTSANPWQDTGAGGKGEPRIDYATSPDGLKWTRQGVAIGKGQPGEWDDARPQAPTKPILRDGIYYLYYAGAGKKVAIGYATSTDLRHWTKSPGNPVLKDLSKCNDPSIYQEDGRYYLFFNDMREKVHYVTSTNLVSWSSISVLTGAVGEGNIVLKDGSTYTILACVGWSHKGEYYKSYTSPSLTNRFTDNGRIKMNIPAWAAGAFGHGDVLRHGDEYWFYFQGTCDLGKTFQIGLARQPVPVNSARQKVTIQADSGVE